MCAAGIAVFEHVGKPDFLKSVTDTGLYLESELQRVSARHGLGGVRGKGLLLALDLKHPSARPLSHRRSKMACCSTRHAPTRCASCLRSMFSREEIAAMIDDWNRC